MAYEIKPNTGSLFVNNKKEKETSSDFNGKLNVNGTLYYISGWKKISRNGEEYINLAINEVKK
jgi:hypothetical protein